MTHEGPAFQDALCKCVTENPSRESTSQQLHRQSKTNNTTTLQVCKRSQSDMIFGANAEWLSWVETRLVRPGSCVPGSRLLMLQGVLAGGGFA
jgi:hypothetical protein